MMMTEEGNLYETIRIFNHGKNAETVKQAMIAIVEEHRNPSFGIHVKMTETRNELELQVSSNQYHDEDGYHRNEALTRDLESLKSDYEWEII